MLYYIIHYIVSPSLSLYIYIYMNHTLTKNANEVAARSPGKELRRHFRALCVCSNLYHRNYTIQV